jgi:hypothetical protein
MKNGLAILMLANLMTLMISCEKDNDGNSNFYDHEYRIGIWINQELTDTLEFTPFSTVIRKGSIYNETYSYWIDDETLFFSTEGWETFHPIIEADKDKVTLDNMYISIEATNNSGTFYKDPVK